MNKVILIGRLCADPEVRYSQNQNQTAVARYCLAADSDGFMNIPDDIGEELPFN